MENPDTKHPIGIYVTVKLSFFKAVSFRDTEVFIGKTIFASKQLRPGEGGREVVKLQMKHKLLSFLEHEGHGLIILLSLLLNMCEIFHNKVLLFLIIKRNVSLNTSIFENLTKVSKLWVKNVAVLMSLLSENSK